MNIHVNGKFITFENERALALTTVVSREADKAHKKMVITDKKHDITFSAEIPLKLLENGEVHPFPTVNFTVLGVDVGEHDTIRKYYDHVGHGWETFKDEFFNEYSRVVNTVIFN